MSMVAVLALCAGAIAGCTSEEQRVRDHLSRADDHLREGDDKAALIELRSALKLSPRDGTINLRIAELMAEQGRAVDALFFYQEAYRLDPSLHAAHLGAARILSFTEPEKAEEQLRGLLELDPANAEVHTALANLALSRKDVAGALAPALTAVELAPDDPQAQLQLGRVYQAQIQIASTDTPAPEATFQAALKAFDHAHEVAGDDTRVAMEASFERARVLSAWPGRHEQARDAYLALIDEAKTSGDSQRLRAAVRVAVTFATRAGNPETTGVILERVVASDPHYHRGWLQLAAFEERNGRSGDAVLERMIAEQPDSAKAHVARAEYLQRAGRPDAAVEQLRRAVDQVEDPLQVRAALSELLYKLGRADEGAEVLAEMEREAPEALETRLARVTAAMTQARYRDAIAILELLPETAERPSLGLILAEAQFRLGDVPAATSTLDRAFQRASSNWVAGLTLRLAIQSASRDWPGFLRTAEQLRRSPAGLTPEQRVAVVEALYEAGRPALARQMLEEMLAEPQLRTGVVALFARREGARDPERARALLEQAIAQHPDKPALVQELAVFEASRGNVDVAVARLDAAIAAPSNERAASVLHMMRARLRLSQGDAAGAESDALAAFQRAPQLPGVGELVAAIAVSRGRVEETIGAFEEQRRAGTLPTSASAALGRLYLAAGRDAEAIAILEEVVRAGGDPAAKNDLAFALAKQNRDLDRALGLAQEAVRSLEPSAAVFDTLGYVYLRKGLYGPALDQFDHAVELARQTGSESAEYHYHRGLALRELERADEAMSAFEAALSVDPGFEEARQARTSLETARAPSDASS